MRNAPIITCIIFHITPQAVQTAIRRLSTAPQTPQPQNSNQQDVNSTSEKSDDPKKKDYTPSVLMRPIGMNGPPRKGENHGIDTRSLQQRRDDFVNWDKHIEKRRRLAHQFNTSYWEDFNAISREHKGKTWIAPHKLFRADKSLYFPNLQGYTLVPPRKLVRDTTDIIVSAPGKPPIVSIVAVFSSMWGEKQVQTFVDHPDVGKAQRVDINVEQNSLKAFFINLFLWSLRKQVPKDRHDKYFIVRRGVTEGLRNQVGLVNGRVGIRWAGSGNATDEEVVTLVKGVRRLVEKGYEEDVNKAIGHSYPSSSTPSQTPD
ncbi:ATP10 protein-domain-containing protein [Kalaharituber pfeilii]|nr:ATP10 protein-domain-containing protein [Kalaharituber pfeilii]